MTELDIASPDAAKLETAPTRYVEGRRIRFAYRRLGPSAGTPLILLQHFSGNIDAWDPAVVNALAAHRPVIVFDNTGVGRSTGQTPDNVEAMARDAVNFINLLGLTEVDLLGFSLGGFIAQSVVPLIRDRTGSNLAPMLFLAACLVWTCAMVLLTKAAMARGRRP